VVLDPFVSVVLPATVQVDRIGVGAGGGPMLKCDAPSSSIGLEV
jgi:hypothetical protein